MSNNTTEDAYKRIRAMLDGAPKQKPVVLNIELTGEEKKGLEDKISYKLQRFANIEPYVAFTMAGHITEMVDELINRERSSP